MTYEKSKIIAVQKKYFIYLFSQLIINEKQQNRTNLGIGRRSLSDSGSALGQLSGGSTFSCLQNLVSDADDLVGIRGKKLCK